MKILTPLQHEQVLSEINILDAKKPDLTQAEWERLRILMIQAAQYEHELFYGQNSNNNEI